MTPFSHPHDPAELQRKVDMYSALLDSLMALSVERRHERSDLEALMSASEDENAELHSELQKAGRTIADLTEQLEIRDEQIQTLLRDYDKDMDLLRETIARQAALIEDQAADDGD